MPQDRNTYGWVEVVVLWIVVVFFAVLLLFGLLIGKSTIVWGHSFYPEICCSGQDCDVLESNRVESVPGGYLIDGLLYVAERDAKNSPDGRYHGCFPGNKSSVRCFWRPPMSM